MIAVGPIFAEAKDKDEFSEQKHKVTAMERMLCKDLKDAGYQVTNDARYRGVLDPLLWEQVRAEFAVHFPKLLVDPHVPADA